MNNFNDLDPIPNHNIPLHLPLILLSIIYLDRILNSIFLKFDTVHRIDPKISFLYPPITILIVPTFGFCLRSLSISIRDSGICLRSLDINTPDIGISLRSLSISVREFGIYMHSLSIDIRDSAIY